jgi:hypothetical protein
MRKAQSNMDLKESVDLRCCGADSCIINPEGRCWCGQVWNGECMAYPEVEDTDDEPRID